MSLDISTLLRLYCERHSTSPDEAIAEIERSTYLNTVKPQDASDHIQGRLLSLLSKLVAPILIVEIGTFSGYATCCLAEGLSKYGRIITIEKKEILRPLIEDHLTKAGIMDRVDVIYGNALDVIITIEESIDLVFIDAAKREYKQYFDTLLPKVKSNGLLIADNTLWKGKVLENKKDHMTSSIHEFNQYVSKHPEVETLLLPYRDGITIMRKK